MAKEQLTMEQIDESALDLAGYLKKCSLCDSTGLMGDDMWCPRCGGLDSVERRAAASLERLSAALTEIMQHSHAGPCDNTCTLHLKWLANQALVRQPVSASVVSSEQK